MGGRYFSVGETVGIVGTRNDNKTGKGGNSTTIVVWTDSTKDNSQNDMEPVAPSLLENSIKARLSNNIPHIFSSISGYLPIPSFDSGSEDQVEEIHDFTLVQKKRLQEENEDEELEMNIKSAGKARDLSPKQIADLKGGYRRIRIGRSLLPLQVKTRRSKESEDN